jgi:hypothetical protein
MSTWHIEPELVRRYVAGELRAGAAMSVDQHLLGCAVCRAAVGATVDPARTDRLWAEIREVVETPVPGPLERFARALGLVEATARLVAATPTLRGAWFLGAALVLTLAALAAGSDERTVALFVALAPVLPVVGVAYAFGPVGDPSREITAATPYPALRLLLVRTAVVVGSTLVPALLLSLLLPGRVLPSVAWLLPALAMAGVTLALADRVPAHLSATALVLAWAGLVGWVGVVGQQPWFAASLPVQLTSAVVLLIAGATVLIHHLSPSSPVWSSR